jgi:hypothetical protein
MTAAALDQPASLQTARRMMLVRRVPSMLVRNSCLRSNFDLSTLSQEPTGQSPLNYVQSVAGRKLGKRELVPLDESESTAMQQTRSEATSCIA